MHPRLSELLAYDDDRRADALGAAGRVPRDRWSDRPTADGWSVIQILEHLRMVEQGVVRLVFKLGKQARAEGTVPEETETSSMLGALDDRRVTDRGRRIEAPPWIHPAATLDADAVVDGLARSRADLHSAAALVDGLALGALRWAHPVLGELDLYQWILFVGQHEARHTLQIAELGGRLG